MKILRCNRCNKNQSSGKFCLDCGQTLTEVITTDVKFKKIDSVKPAETIKKDIRSWLARIGVQQGEISIRNSNDLVEVEYVLNKKKYIFSSHMQKNIQSNLAAVEQFLHYRVLGIERGIESAEQAFAGYEALPDFTGSEDPYAVLGVNTTDNLEQIRSKFKELAKKYHPDINKTPGADLQFQRIVKAMDAIERERS